MTYSDYSQTKYAVESCSEQRNFESPVCDFDSELSVAPRKLKVGFQENDLCRHKTLRKRPKSACSYQDQVGKHERWKILTKGHGGLETRSSSALGLRRHEPSRRRPNSVVDIGDAHLESGKKGCFRNFKRSLKLLGLEPEEFGFPEDPYRYKPDTKNAKPRVNTRVVRRTVSLEDLREAVIREGFDLDADEFLEGNHGEHRQVLAKAVYEEWYFRKQEEAQKEMDETRRQMKVKQWEIQHMKCEKLRKSQESFNEWLQKKRNQMQQEQKRKETIKNKSRPMRYCPSAEQAATAYNAWKKEKDRILQLKQEKAKREMELAEERAAKKAEAEKVFETWKKKADDDIKMKLRETEKKDRDLKEEEERKKKEKELEAESAYRYWKDKKDKESKQRIRETREKQKAILEARVEMLSQRRYESEQAFLEWLDAVDERNQEEMLKRSRTPRLKVQIRPSNI